MLSIDVESTNININKIFMQTKKWLTLIECEDFPSFKELPSNLEIIELWLTGSLIQYINSKSHWRRDCYTSHIFYHSAVYEIHRSLTNEFL